MKKRSVFNDLTPLGRWVVTTLMVCITLVLIHLADTFTIGRTYATPNQLCLTTHQIDVLIDNLHNANPKGNEVTRALNAVKAMNGTVTIVNKKTNEIAVTWKCTIK